MSKDVRVLSQPIPKLTALLAVAAASVVGCVGPEPEPVGAETSPIVGGTLHSGHPGVGALVIDYSGYFEQFCTATLIDPQWAITAAHCLDETDVEPYMTSFFVGADARTSSGGTSYDVDAFFQHPDYDPSDHSNDIGLVHLRTRVSGVSTYAYGGTPRAGMGLTWVGYGVTRGGGDDNGQKRIGTGTVGEVYWMQYQYNFSGSMPCQGDSGGPAFASVSGVENVVGVISAGDETCTEYGVDTRVDYFLSWITATLSGSSIPGDCRITGGDCGGQACFPVDTDETACLPSDGLAVGAACNANGEEWGSTVPCRDGSICIRTSPTDPRGGECMAFCRSDADCPGIPCDIPIFTDIPDVGVCYDTACTDADGDGHCVSVDCDDHDGSRHPGATEVCDDGIDQDCDGQVDELCGGCTDADGDGHCIETDCNDGDPGVNPGAVDICGDGIDQDCDGTVDETCGCTDADADGLCDFDDCNDLDPAVGRPAPEDCANGLDDDCDGMVDGGDSDCGTGPGPDDGDGGGAPPPPCQCTAAGTSPAGYPLLAGLVGLALALLRRRQ